ncbi:conserved hypothetical protein [Ricinus communis]|uniref:Uncharacterized protein n=1 Tax=Ricinus communis TaxID=3988 RepID=B9SG34_RICCO|nr:conserved hypothetical protein [Ricinus communis]
MGFWKTNCSELWERLHIPDAPPLLPSASEGTNLTSPPPLPSASSGENLTAPPTSASSGSVHYVLPGMFSVRGILILYILFEFST